MKRLPAGVRVVQCLAAAALALQAFTAGADHGKNHYILDCELSCAPPPVATVATATPIGAPGAVTTDARGNVYFSSPNIVFRLARDGTLARIAGNGTPGFAGDDGPATDALLNFPTYYPERDADSMDFLPFVGPLPVDAAGNVFIGDAYSNRIRRVDTAGTVTTLPVPVTPDTRLQARTYEPRGCRASRRCRRQPLRQQYLGRRQPDRRRWCRGPTRRGQLWLRLAGTRVARPSRLPSIARATCSCPTATVASARWEATVR